MAKGKKSIMSPEEKEERERIKEEKFKKLAKARTSRAILAMESLMPLSSRTYSSTQEERDKIINALSDAIDKVDKVLNNQIKLEVFEF